jgi:hypothetical protein
MDILFQPFINHFSKNLPLSDETKAEIGSYLEILNLNKRHLGENAHIDHPIALQTDHPKLLFFQRV